MATKSRKEQRQKRHRRLRKKISGTSAIPRMAVCTTEKHIYVQFINDESGHTIASASSLSPEFREQNLKSNSDGAGQLGKLAADKAKSAGIENVVFDRGGFGYKGRVKALAEAAREAGLKF
ncbi:MAG: 50S ribosomal protein L18 [Lentisphaeria bacterium]|nr:50S ribosomal protein L18 [Lentisphaeria bacterium]NQZ67473.1 50S ribosomal protein L18 [Lentisphaeria bacterium]